MISPRISGRWPLHRWWGCLLLVWGVGAWSPTDVEARTRELFGGTVIVTPPAGASLVKVDRDNYYSVPRGRSTSYGMIISRQKLPSDFKDKNQAELAALLKTRIEQEGVRVSQLRHKGATVTGKVTGRVPARLIPWSKARINRAQGAFKVVRVDQSTIIGVGVFSPDREWNAPKLKPMRRAMNEIQFYEKKSRILRREIWPGAFLRIPADAKLDRQLQPNPRDRNYSVCFVAHPSFTSDGLFVERNRWTQKMARAMTLQKLAQKYRKALRNENATVRVRGSFLTIDYRLSRSGKRGLFVGAIQARAPSGGAALINATFTAKTRDWNSPASRRTRAAAESLSLRR